MFIKLHGAIDNEPMYCNVDTIHAISVDKGETFIDNGKEFVLSVKETPEEIVTLIDLNRGHELLAISEVLESAIKDGTTRAIIEWTKE